MPKLDVDQRDCVPLGLEDDHSMGCNRRETEAWEVKDAPKIIMFEGHGQRTTSCPACNGTGKKSIVSIKIANCRECDRTGRRRCDVCGGTGEVEPANSK